VATRPPVSASVTPTERSRGEVALSSCRAAISYLLFLLLFLFILLKRNEAAEPLKQNEAAEPLKQNEAARPLKQNEAAEPLKQNEAARPQK